MCQSPAPEGCWFLVFQHRRA
uniref:Uncharacterized protein n=1 Tax=Anguilla anguilla TaxID=7936 RepID=A0A0E9SLD2_ANGAN